MILFALTALLGLIYVVIQLWIAAAWVGIDKGSEGKKNVPGITMLIAARNEYENLKRFLPAILQQDYPEYEVIVVLDRCEDDSKGLLTSWQETYPHLQWVEVTHKPDEWNPKNWALTQGIAQAQYPWLAFTDADCEVSAQWLSSIQRRIGKETQIVLGMGKYYSYPGLLNYFIRFETFYSVFQYMGIARRRMPYCAVGRNLAYQQQLHTAGPGYRDFKDLPGDDDLFVCAHATPVNTEVMVHPDSWTYTEPHRNIRAWARQKFRHVNVSSRYPRKIQALLGLFHLSHLGFYIGIILAFFVYSTYPHIIALYVIRVWMSGAIFFWVNRYIREKRLLWMYPLLDGLFVLYNCLIVPLGLLMEPTWKK